MKDAQRVESCRAAWDKLSEKLDEFAAEENLSVEEIERMSRILERLLKTEFMVQSMERSDPDNVPDVDISVDGVD